MMVHRTFSADIVPCSGKKTMSSSDVDKGRDVMKQYKVLSQKDKWFSRKFDPETLEQALNSYASQGWQVISIATATIPGLTGAREEMVVVFERDA